MLDPQNLRALSLVVCTAAYLVIGTAIFDALESPNEEEQRNRIKTLEEEIILKYNLTTEELGEIENLVSLKGSVKHWSFTESLYFTMTVITTIGY